MANDVSYFKVSGDSTTYQFNDPDAENRIGALESTVNDQAGDIADNTSAIGTLSSLTTSAKDNLAAAVNEVDAHADTNASAISQLNSKLANLIGFKIVDIGNVTITSGGYLSLENYRPSFPTGYSFMFAMINTYGSSSTKTAFSLTDNGTWLIGTAGDTITGLKVSYYYCRTGCIGRLT